ncbi:MAG: hypothetical protein WA918_13450 [Erythrobacter sp.]
MNVYAAEFLAVFASAIGFALWQYFKMDRELKRSWAERKAGKDEAVERGANDREAAKCEAARNDEA